MLLPALFASLGQLTFALGQDVLVLTGQSIFGCHITNGTVQSNLIIVPYKPINNPLGIFKGDGRFRPDGIRFEGFVPAFKLTVTLGIAG